MDSENIDVSLGQRVAKVIEATLSELLDTNILQALKERLKQEYRVDFMKYEGLLQNPESLEKALISMLGEGAALLLRTICGNLTTEFSLNPPESIRYRKVGDYVKLIYRIKETYRPNNT